MNWTNFLIGLAAYLIASLIFSFLLSQILISLCCSKPITEKLRIMFGKAADYGIISRKINSTIFLNSIILAMICGFIVGWGNGSVMIGTGIAFVITFFKVLAASGMRESNINEYVNVYLKDAYGDEEWKQHIVTIFSKE